MKDKNRIIGLDLSTKNSGWAIFEGDQLIAHDVINAGSPYLFERIEKMTSEIERVLKAFQPTKAVIEEVLPEDVEHNQKTFKALIYLQAFIMHLMYKYNIEAELVVASHWRKGCGIETGPGIKRISLKPRDIDFVKKMYSIEVGDDEADAICIGWSSTHKPIPIQENEVIKDEYGFEFA